VSQIDLRFQKRAGLIRISGVKVHNQFRSMAKFGGDVEQALGSRLDQSRLLTPTPNKYFRDFVYSDACRSDIGSSDHHPMTQITTGSLINYYQAFEWLTRHIESLKCT
jgi:hypothetical protein